MLEPINLDDAFLEQYYDRLNLVGGKFKLSDMREDPVKFAKFMLGFTVRDYQAHLMDKITQYQKLAVVKGRQIGFSTSIALYCLWFAWFGKAKTGANNNTEITVISKDDDAAKKLLQQIKDFMYLGDKQMSNFLKGRKEHSTCVFSKEIVQSNVDILKLKNGAIIRSFPPTGKVRGTSNDIVFVDEFAFLNNPDVRNYFYADLMPTISETGGKIICSSTPNGYGNFFYELIDPEDKFEKHEFERFMYPYSVNLGSATYEENVRIMKEHMDENKFLQEYECSFECADVSFFDSKKVKEMFVDMSDLNPDKYEYVAAIDYGMTQARTVISLCTRIEGIIYRMYYKEFPAEWDSNGVIDFMRGLMDRFKIVKIIGDYCPQGESINQKMRDLGWNVHPFDFHTEKVSNFVAFRSLLNKGEIKAIHDEATEKQFIEMQQEESKTGKLQIHKPRSGRDDIVDSFVMAASHYLQDRQTFGVYFV